MVAPLRNRILLVMLGLYMLLNQGFMQVRIPPIGGGGVPIGEIVLMFSLATINYLVVFRDLSEILLLVPFVLWWTVGIGRAFAQVPEYGFWALRDASSVIESLFLIAGFAFAARVETLEKFFGWLPRIIAFGCIYSLLFPWRDVLVGLSPTITAGAGYETHLLFHFQGISNLLIMAFCYILLFGRRTWLEYALAFSLLAFAVFMWQARTIYLQVIAVYILFFAFRRDAFHRSLLAVVVIILFLLVVPNIGWKIEGRLGQPVSVEFVFNHILAIFGIERAGVEGAAAGVPLRIGWWTDLYNSWTGSLGNMFFGVGYGMPLTSFTGGTGVVVREPHNSYISVIARLGLVGAINFFWMHILLVRVWWRGYKKSRNLEWQEGQNRFLLLLVFFVLIWIGALGEDAFEKPFNSIPYYFLWGVVIRFTWHLAQAVKGELTT
jgi:hypothetical protein